MSLPTRFSFRSGWLRSAQRTRGLPSARYVRVVVAADMFSVRGSSVHGSSNQQDTGKHRQTQADDAKQCGGRLYHSRTVSLTHSLLDLPTPESTTLKSRVGGTESGVSALHMDATRHTPCCMCHHTHTAATVPTRHASVCCCSLLHWRDARLQGRRPSSYPTAG